MEEKTTTTALANTQKLMHHFIDLPRAHQSMALLWPAPVMIS